MPWDSRSYISSHLLLYVLNNEGNIEEIIKRITYLPEETREKILLQATLPPMDKLLSCWGPIRIDGNIRLTGNKPFSVAYSLDNRFLAAGDRTVRMWDMATNAVVATLRDPGRAITFVAYSPNSLWPRGQRIPWCECGI